jgi:hypothetical protein
VVDDFYFNPVPDVEVTVFHSDSTLAGIDSTDVYGIYALSLSAGEYYAFFTKENYADTTISDITITPEGTTIVDLTFDFIGICEYVVGDVNGSQSMNGLDVTFGINYFKYGYPEPIGCRLAMSGMYAAMSTDRASIMAWISLTILQYIRGDPRRYPAPTARR